MYFSFILEKDKRDSILKEESSSFDDYRPVSFLSI